jgi:hypothetical protein
MEITDDGSIDRDGSPWVLAKGLLGMRVEAIRPGISTVEVGIGRLEASVRVRGVKTDKEPCLCVLPSRA